MVSCWELHGNWWPFGLTQNTRINLGTAGIVLVSLISGFVISSHLWISQEHQDLLKLIGSILKVKYVFKYVLYGCASLLWLQTQNNFQIGWECVTCHVSKQSNSLGPKNIKRSLGQAKLTRSLGKKTALTWPALSLIIEGLRKQNSLCPFGPCSNQSV